MKNHSFRDPAGHLLIGNSYAFRIAPFADEAEVEDIEPILGQLQSEGLWTASEPIPFAEALSQFPEGIRCRYSTEPHGRAWKHPLIFFPSYAYEWCPGMLGAAGELTLEICRRLLSVGWELKDASTTNVLFQGPKPIFIDHLSPSPRDPSQLGWIAYGQFQRNFIIPLMLHKLNRTPLAWMSLAHRDGISPQSALQQLSLLNRLRPSVLASITLPAMWSNTAPPKNTEQKIIDPSIASSVTQKLLHGLTRKLRQWSKYNNQSSNWSGYGAQPESYSPDGKSHKEQIVETILAEARPKSVLDLGCNTGIYTEKAARLGARCVAIDSDPVCIERLWQRSCSENLDILPLIMDLGRPSPAIGWENGEQLSFLSRARGKFDLVMAFALIHHLIVRERISIELFSEYIASLTSDWALVEWVPPNDPHFMQIAGTNINLYKDINSEHFEQAISNQFYINLRQPIAGGGRVLYGLRKRDLPN